ncbi:MAG: hypothetical protein H6733_13360 [Alphaproteobacteria bacterium]|nr:hypothetical protein [Alphaproteobacteria bacterium]
MRLSVAAALVALALPFAAAAQESEDAVEEGTPDAPEPDAVDPGEDAVDAAPGLATTETSTAVGRDLEDRGSRLERQDSKLGYAVFFETEWHEYDNLDFRKLDESSDQAILDSDDRNGFAFTGIGLELGYKIDPSVRFVINTSYRGFWGNDQIGQITGRGGFFYFNNLYAEYTPANLAWKPRIRVGRQRFSIGGQGGATEFILADTLDMVRIDLPLGNIGTLTLIPINVIGLSSDNDDVNFIGFIGQQNTQLFGFRGDRMSRRYGGVLTINPEPLPAFDARVYAFYNDLGALGSGSDISYGGRLGNFSDNDWVMNAGLRAAFTIADVVTPFASFDASFGIDRKELVTNDVNTNGFAWSAGVTFDKREQSNKDWGLHGEAVYFEAQGAAYLDNGQQWSHGYVGLKARQVGGMLANRFLGWHPSAYTDSYGVVDSPQDTSRKAGTRTAYLNVDVGLPGPVGIGVGYWFLQDTGISALDQSLVDTITPPFGYSREEYKAQARLGKVLGHEIDGRLLVDVTPSLRLYAYGAALLPGAYYGVEIGRAAGTALGSADPQVFWDAGAGVSVQFDNQGR